MMRKYIVIADDQIIGEFTKLEDATAFQLIYALGGNEGDRVFMAEIVGCLVTKEEGAEFEKV